MTKTVERIDHLNEHLNSEIIDSIVTTLGSNGLTREKLRDALKKRQQIMRASYKEVVSVGDYVKVVNPNSPYFNIIGKVLDKKLYSNSVSDYVVTDINIRKRIPLADIEKFY